MDFHALIAKLDKINRAPAQTKTARQLTNECDMAVMPLQSNMGAMSQTQSPPPHPSMNVSLNAQGMDNIQDIFRLIQKVNPDVDQTKTISAAPMLGIDDVTDNYDMDTDFDSDHSMKHSIDLDNDHDIKHGIDLDSDDDIDLDSDDDMGLDLDSDDDMDKDMHELGGDYDSDGDIDNDDLEGNDEIILGGSFDSSTDEDGGFQSSTTRPLPKYRDMDYMNNELAGGMNRPKGTHPRVAGGDNPMQPIKDRDEAFKESIRNDLRRRLAEAKKPSACATKSKSPKAEPGMRESMRTKAKPAKQPKMASVEESYEERMDNIFFRRLAEAKKASEGMTKKEKSAVVKKAKAGEDIGKPGKNFDKVAKAAGGGEKGKKIAASAMWKNQAKK